MPLISVDFSRFAPGALYWMAATAAILASGCHHDAGVPEGAPIEHVILVTIDTLRADHVGVLGGRATTPTLDRIAAEGTVFTRCISQTPLTLPSHTTILSGTYPPYHGVRDNGGFVVPEELELISEILRREGYSTAAFVGAYVLHSKWGLDQGFDTYSDSFDRERYDHLLLQNSKRADEVLADARKWIEDHRRRRFFAWIHLFDPHTPYRPPPPFDADPDHLYRGEVEYTDHAFGEFIDSLDGAGLLHNTLIVVTADHGEGLGEHGEQEHGFFIYDSTVRVPLIIRPPSGNARRSWDGLVELADVAPTILEALGVRPPPGIQGRSLWPAVSGRPMREKTRAYTETYYPSLHFGWSELHGLYRSGFKYVEAPRPELYDLRVDAGERLNLAPDDSFSPVLYDNESTLRHLREELSIDALDPTAAMTSADDRAALQALGYVTGTPSSHSATQAADPKDKIEVFTRLTEAAALVREGQFEAAISTAEAAIDQDPRLVDAHVLLGNALRATGRLDDAILRYGVVLDLKPDCNFAMIDLMSALMDSGAPEEAIRQGRRFLAVFPNDAILHELQGAAFAAVHDHDNALRHFRRSLALSPVGEVQLRTAEILVLEGRAREASEAARRALDLDPSISGASYLLGRIADADGRTEEALSYFHDEVALHPDAYMAAFNAALISAERGQREEAVRLCRVAIAHDPPFGLPYFLIAADLLARGVQLDEAIELCRRGIRAAPEDTNTLIGYQTLLRLLQRTGDRAAFQRAAAEAEELRRKLGNS